MKLLQAISTLQESNWMFLKYVLQKHSYPEPGRAYILRIAIHHLLLFAAAVLPCPHIQW